MKKTRSHLAVIAVVASLSFLAACSEGEDNAAVRNNAVEAPAPVVETQPASPVAPEPTTSEKIEADAEKAKADAEKAKADVEKKSDELKESADRAADAVGDKASELKEAAERTAEDVGDAIKKGAAKADHAIQDKLGNGVQPKAPAQPSEEAKP